jgi:cysteinyl-tRNA synthetase
LALQCFAAEKGKMKLYNTMSRSIEDFVPMKAPEVGLYACGFTVYDYTHLGHLRKYTMDDVLIRTLRHAGYKVKFVQNVTDVGHLASDADTGEDKLEKGAKKYGKSVWDIAREFEEYFFRSMDLMGNARPDVSCRATDHIQEQLEMVIALEEKGFAYVVEGDGVYFDTSKDPDYGKLARLKPEDLQEGARVERVAGKRNPTDFALWKFERPGENRAMVWKSPWAERSFPGWHIECSAMAMKYLGPQFDIHTGGIDHIPVHHTNEIAQAESATGKEPFVKYWVHHNFLRVDGEKMSKSLGNFFTIDDILKRNIDPKALRLLLLTTHYRSEMNFTWENLEGTSKTWQKLAKQVVQLRTEEGRTVLSDEKLAKVDEYRQRFFAYMEEDLKTPEAVAVIYEVIKSNIPGPDKYDLLVEFDEVLGLGFRTLQNTEQESAAEIKVENLSKEIQDLYAKRQTARQEKDWMTADQLRDELLKLGYEVVDGPSGQELRQVHPSVQTSL